MPEIVDVAEETGAHKDEWLLFELTEDGEGDRPAKGRLLCHSKSYDEIHDVIMRSRKPGVCLQTIFTGDPNPAGKIVLL